MQRSHPLAEELELLDRLADRPQDHQTRPQTLAYGLTDSPAGQLAWNSGLFMGFGADVLPPILVPRSRIRFPALGRTDLTGEGDP